MLFFQKQASPAIMELLLESLNRSRNHFNPSIRDVRFLFFLYRILNLIIMFILCLPFYLYIYISMTTRYFHLFIYIVCVYTHHAHKNTVMPVMYE